jgi:hypothetical protein
LPEVKDMLLSLRRRLGCWRRTWGMHEVQLHMNVCRYCKEPWSKLYPKNDPASIPTVPEPDPTVGHVESDTAPRFADTRSL